MRRVRLDRTSRLQFTATNSRGGTLAFGSGHQGEFTPVELLLTAIAGCTAMDVDAITVKRSEPDTFTVLAASLKVRDASGNHLSDVVLDFDVRFPETDGGRLAEAVLPTAIERSHNVLCTVSRTVELGADIEVRLQGTKLADGPVKQTTENSG